MEKGFFKAFLRRACAYCTVLTFIIMAVKFLGAGDSIYEPTFSVARMTGLLLFGAVAALAGQLFKDNLPDNFLKYVLHFFINMVGFVVLIYLPMAGEAAYESALSETTYEVPNLFAAIGIGVILYVASYTAYFVILAVKGKKKNKAKDYKSVYKK